MRIRKKPLNFAIRKALVSFERHFRDHDDGSNSSRSDHGGLRSTWEAVSKITLSTSVVVKES